MNIVDRIFQRRPRSAPPLGSAEIAAEIEARKAAQDTAKAGIADAALRRAAACEALDATGIVAAESEAVLARAEVEVAEHAIRELQKVHADAVTREAADALTSRREAVERRVRAEASKLLDEYDRLASQMATVLAAKTGLDREVELTNEALKAARRHGEMLDSIDRRFRFAAGRQEPDSVQVVEETQVQIDGEWVRAVQLLRLRDGSMGSEHGPTRVEKREIRRPGRKRPDTWLPSLVEVRLPAGRIGGSSHWPREAQS